MCLAEALLLAAVCWEEPGKGKPKSVSFHNLLQEQNLCTTWIVSLQFFFSWVIEENIKKIPVECPSCYPYLQIDPVVSLPHSHEEGGPGKALGSF